MVMFNFFTTTAITHINKIILAVVCVVVVALILDTSLIKTSAITTSQSGSPARVDFFVMVLSITIIGQFLILGYVRQKNVGIRRNKELHINTIQKIVEVLQVVITGILIFIILQILLTNQYNLDLLVAATAISYSLATAMMGLLAMRFFSWLKPYRNSVLLSYCLASAVLAINIVSAFFLVVLTLPSNQPQEVVSHFGENIPFLMPGSASVVLDSLFDISSILSFIMMWIATCILLRHYSRKFGKVKFWIVVGIPLIYFLSQFLTLSLNIFGSLLSSQSIFYGIVLTLIFTFSKSADGILFGFALWTVTRHISKTSVVRDYMIISAFGLILLFTSNQASVLLSAPYPPFGLAAASFVGLSSYLVLLGIYSSAISVAQDRRLRQTIRQSAIEEAKLLVSIGSAQMEQEIQRRVLYIAKQQEGALTQETGIHSSLTVNDMRNYLSAVLGEIRVLKNVDEILIKEKEILEQSAKFLVCSKLGQIRLVYHNYFDLYEKVMYKYTKAEHEGIKMVTSIERDSAEIIRKFLDIGVQIRHVKNMPPIDFAVSDKEMVATIEKTESSQMIQNLLVSSEIPYIDHFASIFEELWKNGVDAKDRIKAIKEGIDTEGIEIIQNPAEIQKHIFDLVKSANEEILVIFSTANAFHRQEYLGAMQFLKEATTGSVETTFIHINPSKLCRGIIQYTY
ncbi:MAG: hypothetical protein DLM72_21140 [Candidatus Nitrosopolaris wilkensis]|nr:MAG: hypothetical protein DLM72_21140 [Candidatus Nitrosopolaris wilkensis]